MFKKFGVWLGKKVLGAVIEAIMEEVKRREGGQETKNG